MERWTDGCTSNMAETRVRVRPWLLWRRRGSKRFRVRDRRVDLAWDLSRARFPPSGSPEPSSGYFVAVVVDGEGLVRGRHRGPLTPDDVLDLVGPVLIEHEDGLAAAAPAEGEALSPEAARALLAAGAALAAARIFIHRSSPDPTLAP